MYATLFVPIRCRGWEGVGEGEGVIYANESKDAPLPHLSGIVRASDR